MLRAPNGPNRQQVRQHFRGTNLRHNQGNTPLVRLPACHATLSVPFQHGIVKYIFTNIKFENTSPPISASRKPYRSPYGVLRLLSAPFGLTFCAAGGFFGCVRAARYGLTALRCCGSPSSLRVAGWRVFVRGACENRACSSFRLLSRPPHVAETAFTLNIFRPTFPAWIFGRTPRTRDAPPLGSLCLSGAH